MRLSAHLLLAAALLTVGCETGPEQQVPATVAPIEPAGPVAEAPEAPPLPVPDKPAEPEDGFMVIVAGSKDQAEAKQKYEAFSKAGPKVGDFPAMFVSADVEGLNPGFHIVVAAIPRDEATAKQMAKALGTKWEGTYVRKVKVVGVEDVGCDKDPRCLLARWAAIIAFNYSEDGVPDEWGANTAIVTKRARAAGLIAREAKMDHNMVDTIKIGNKVVAKVEIGPFLNDQYGYVVVGEGKAPEYFQGFGVDSAIDSIERHLEVEIP